MASKRLSIIEALKARAEAIRIRDGFNTDAGDQVFLGEAPTLGEGDPPVGIAILLGKDDVSRQGSKVLVQVPVLVVALAKADIAGDPWLAVEEALEDVKRAIELDDLTLGGLLRGSLERGSTETLPREPGATTVGTAITYLCAYAETWGAP